MTLFKNRTAQEIWVDHWCGRCYRTRDGRTDCAIIARALERQRKPPQWDRNQRAKTMADAYTCDEFRTKPPRPTKAKKFDDVPMFDVPDTGSKRFVPVAGWPDDPKRKDTDHA
jgi:hypothetical protein